MRVVFMGTPDFAVQSLNALVTAGHEVAAVITQPDRPKGRGQATGLSGGENQSAGTGVAGTSARLCEG